MTHTRSTVLAMAMALLFAPTPARPAVPRTPLGWYTVTSFPSIQAAIDSCIANGGGVVYFPPGTYVLPATQPTLRLDRKRLNGAALRGVMLVGDGPDVSEIQAAPGTSATMLRVERDDSGARGLSFRGNADDTTSVGIVLGDGGPGVLTRFLTFRDVTVRNAGRWALGTAPHAVVLESSFDGCRFLQSSPSALGGLVRIGPGSTTLHFTSCSFEAFYRNAVTLDGAAGVTFINCVFEGERDDNGPFLYLHRSTDCAVQFGWFEDDATRTGASGAMDQWFVELDQACHGFTLLGSLFLRDGVSGKVRRQPRALHVLGTGPDACIGVVVENADLGVTGVVDSTVVGYVDVAGGESQVHVIGGALRDSLAYRRVILRGGAR